MLNPDYPSSWWVIAYSDDVRRGEVIPIRALERDLVLWRDGQGQLVCQSAHCPHLGAHLGYGGEVIAGRLHCPFHGWEFDPSGHVAAQPGVDTHRESRGCLSRFQTVEYLQTIFVWTGATPPDHDVPDLLGARGLKPADVSCFHNRFRLPFQAKGFLENTQDGNHFGAVHDVCEYAVTEVVHEDSTEMSFRIAFENRRRYFSVRHVLRAYRRGELLVPGVPGRGYVATTYGSGVHVLGFKASYDQRAQGLMKHLEHAILISGWTPIERETHTFHGIVVIPGIPWWAAPLLRPLLGALITRFLWGGVVQDSPIQVHRREPDTPAFNKLDRALVRFRRFWDRRLENAECAPNGAESGWSATRVTSP